MEYRPALYTDWPAIAEYINGLGYFMAVDPAELGGNWLIAVDETGKVHGTIWFFRQGAHAYIDYWAGSALIAARLATLADRVLKLVGVRYVRALIATHNAAALKLAGALGMTQDPQPYSLMFRSL